MTILTKDDYRLVTYDYLARCAAEDTIYVEMFSSPNHAAEVGMSYTDHLDGIAVGCIVTLNSDDPPFFGTSIGHEYVQAARTYGLTENDLKNITRNAISAAFCDEELKEKLHSRI